MKTQLIPSVNFHLWKACNFRCKFCYATFQDIQRSMLPKGHLSKEQTTNLIDRLAEAGFSKITFAGGEPTLCPWLAQLLVRAKENGLTTSIVTNGSNLSEQFLESLQGHLDWVAISIDSANVATNKMIGRTNGIQIAPNADWYLLLGARIKKYGYRLKINTVVTNYNYHEKALPELIKTIGPDRWKILQVLPIKKQNYQHINSFEITAQQFKQFKTTCIESNLEFQTIFERNAEMTGTYVMIDPAGRFFDNSSGMHTYSDPILEIGVANALKQVRYDHAGFLARGGIYNWK